MFQVKRLMEEKAEENLTNIILEQVRKNNMTILNIKEITAKVISYLESNAVLEVENIQMKSNFKMKDISSMNLPEIILTEKEGIAPADIIHRSCKYKGQKIKKY